MNILYILKHDPWGIGGGCYASRCFLDAFTTAFEDAHFDACLCAEYLPKKDMREDYPNVKFVKVSERSFTSKIFSVVTGLLHRFDRTAREMMKNGKYDYCIFDHNSIAGPLVGICRELGVKTVVINHNCEQEYYHDNHRNWVHRLFLLPHVKRAEQNSYIGCDYNIFLTSEDKTLFGNLYGKSQTRAMVIGCFEPKGSIARDYVKKIKSDSLLKLVISGTIGNVQNLDGINYFIDNLIETVPADIEVVITGKNPPMELQNKIEAINDVKKYAKITLIPNPKDIMPVVADCDMFLCPTKLGGGIKLRIMDGLKAGLPVIAHRVSARGYSAFAEKGLLFAFDDKNSFKVALDNCIVSLRADSNLRQDISGMAQQQFSFERNVELLKQNINM